jgi:hypothetical protein
MRPSRGKRDNSYAGSLPQEIAERAKNDRQSHSYAPPRFYAGKAPPSPEKDKRSRQIRARADVKLALPKLSPADDDEQRAAERMARLTGICPACGDGGFFIDRTGFHYCTCKRGRVAEEEDKDD